MEEMKIAFFNIGALAINLTSINEELKFLSLALACIHPTLQRSIVDFFLYSCFSCGAYSVPCFRF